MLNNRRPYIMSIAGYDPSGGAGVLADVKVFEQHQVYGFAVITSNTIQNDRIVKSVRWLPVNEILQQIDVLLDKFTVNVFKIGITENAEMLNAIKNHLLTRNKKASIIWDPVLSASSGYNFFTGDYSVTNLLEGIYLITPNFPEFKNLFASEENAYAISYSTAIYLKGGHLQEEKGKDVLFINGKKLVILPCKNNLSCKHGSGCILSSAIAANLAKGESLEASCRNAKIYTEKILASNNQLLAYHS